MKKLTVTQKRWLLSAHILFVVGWLGAGLCSLVLNIIAASTSEAPMPNIVYTITEDLDKALLRGSALGALVTGILLSVLTHWGLIRFYWIIVKEIFTILSIILGFTVSSWTVQAISMTSAAGLHALHNPLYTANQTMLFIGITCEIVSLSALIIISVFKPWGQRKKPGKPPAIAPKN